MANFENTVVQISAQVQDEIEGEPLQPFHFRLKAIDSGSSLELYVLTDTGATAAHFKLKDANGDLVLDGSPYTGSDVFVESSQRQFMAQGVSRKLTMVTPADGAEYATPILGDTMDALRVVSTAQSTAPASDHPSFVERFDSQYLMRSRGTSEPIALNVGAPAKAVVARVAEAGVKAAVTSTTAMHPWLSARALLSPSLESTAAARSGSSVASVKAALVNVDPFFVAKDKALVLFRPSVQVAFQTAFHPHVTELARRLEAEGVDSLLSLDSQSLGNPYLRSPWSAGYVLSAKATGPSSIIEGGVGRDPVSGRPGNLEAVVLEGSRLLHYWHDSSDVAGPWQPALAVTEKATGPGVLTERVSERKFDPQGRVQARGTFDVVVPQAEGLAHYSWANTQPAQWTPNGIITAAAVGPGALLESDYLTANQKSLEVLVPEQTADPTKWRLARYRLDNSDKAWKFVDLVNEDVSGSAGFLQSNFVINGHGRLEALVLQRNPLVPGQNNLVHFWRDESVAAWQMGAVISDAASHAGAFIESRVGDSQSYGNSEALVVEGTQLVHYWRDNSIAGRPWQRGQIISTVAESSGCIIESHFGAVGNFEVVVLENGCAQHYWHSNEGPVGSLGERFYFSSYDPTASVDDPYPRHDVAFALGEPYSKYNWELFFHLPMLVATRLMRSQRFSDARRWFHRVFNPTDDSNELTTQRFWKFLPLRAEDRVGFDQMLLALQSSDPQDAALAADMRNEIADWLAHPFLPHRIARARIGAYKKNVVMKYVELLIAEGDQMFRAAPSIEAINTLTQRYVMAKNIMGRRPESVPSRTEIPSKTYADLRKAGIDDFGDTVVQLENELPFAGDAPSTSAVGEAAGILGMTSSLYFRIPQNDQLLAYWDTIDDRLFKVRNSMNIEGVVRQLPLSEPPIDPMMLVEAAAKGMSLSSALASMNAPLPFYRFTHTLQKALEMCGEVRAIGAAVLAALEKQDAEALAHMRASQEAALLTFVQRVKEQQLSEANTAADGLRASRDIAVTRWLHYQQMLGQSNGAPPEPDVKSTLVNGVYQIVPTVKRAATYTPSSRFELVDMGSVGIGASLDVGGLGVSAAVSEDDNPGTKILSYEKQELVQSFEATVASVAGSVLEGLGGLLAMIPTFGAKFSPLGVGGSISFGGSNMAGGNAAAARATSLAATIFSHNASRASKLGSLVLREREWGLQNDLAAREIFQIDQQLVAAHVRIDLAQRELEAHQKQVDNALAIDAFLQSKFTNVDLYSWMQEGLVNLYSAAFDLAFAAAKRAELCYRLELGVTDSSFIQPVGYWDGLHSGLLAGERLSVALRQLERAYEDQNQREYELTTHVSLLQIDPLQLIRLKETGVCEFEVTEGRLDFEHPGHYFRRIKSVSLTIPCVVGPYVGVSCTLRLQESAIRFQTTAGKQYPRTGDDDGRFLVNRATTQAIATSSAQNDPGLFEVNFRDERYLPFEGAGAISSWRLELSGALPQFDYQTIADVVVHLRYTAREGGERIKAAAAESLRNTMRGTAPGPVPLHGSSSAPTPPARLFSLRHEFPNEWQRLTRPPAASEPDMVVRTVDLPILKSRFPFYLTTAVIQPLSVFVVAVPKLEGQLPLVISLALKPSPNDLAAITIGLASNSAFGRGLAGGTNDGAVLAKVESDPAKTWSLGLSLDRASMQALSDGIQDLFMVVEYAATFPA